MMIHGSTYSRRVAAQRWKRAILILIAAGIAALTARSGLGQESVRPAVPQPPSHSAQPTPLSNTVYQAPATNLPKPTAPRSAGFNYPGQQVVEPAPANAAPPAGGLAPLNPTAFGSPGQQTTQANNMLSSGTAKQATNPSSFGYPISADNNSSDQMASVANVFGYPPQTANTEGVLPTASAPGNVRMPPMASSREMSTPDNGFGFPNSTPRPTAKPPTAAATSFGYPQTIGSPSSHQTASTGGNGFGYPSSNSKTNDAAPVSSKTDNAWLPQMASSREAPMSNSGFGYPVSGQNATHGQVESLSTGFGYPTSRGQNASDLAASPASTARSEIQRASSPTTAPMARSGGMLSGVVVGAAEPGIRNPSAGSAIQTVGYVAPDDCASSCATAADVKPILGLHSSMVPLGREARWSEQCLIPWESFAYGEYIGPHRTPHMADYCLRVNDQLEFVFMLDRTVNGEAYRLSAGDMIQISSGTDPDLNQEQLTILSDGTVSLRLVGRVKAAELTIEQLQQLLNEKYVERGVKAPEIVVQVVQSDTPLRDLRDAVDARFGSGGQARTATIAPDGTIQLPLIQSVPAVGLTLSELSREINARYRERIRGIDVTPILSQRAPTFVYVLGEVNQPGQVTLTGPTTVMQAISQAGGWRQGANLETVIVFRRDAEWRLVATRLNMRGPLSGQRPLPPDEIWLRDSDIVLVPKMSIQRLSELVDMYFTRTIYGVLRIPGTDYLFDTNSVITE